MPYLERNIKLIAEVDAGITLEKGEKRGNGNYANFFSVGRFNSTEMGTEVHVGLKEPQRVWARPELIRDRFIFELAVMSVVAKNMPHLLPELPLFYGLLIGKNGVPIAIVTEDFSQNGDNDVESSNYVPPGFQRLFVDGSLDYDKLVNISFTVSPKNTGWEGAPFDALPPIGALSIRRIVKFGDLYPLLTSPAKREAHRTRFPEKEIEEQLDQHTLKIDHDL